MFVRDLHTRLFGPIWEWGGQQRRLELNIGVASDQIAVELRNALGTIAYRWEHTDDWTPRELGIVVHAETVRVHPFAADHPSADCDQRDVWVQLICRQCLSIGG